MKLAWLCLLLLSTMACVKSTKNPKPNVIVILSDDIGLGDISKYRRIHSSDLKIETPNIDKLADQGMMFTNAYAPAALCATTRYAVMTGNYNFRSPEPWGVWSGYAPGVFTENTLTLGRLMQKAGYSTSFFGKWHMGTQFRKKSNPNELAEDNKKIILKDIDITHIAAHGPMQNGFDYSFTLPSGIQSVPYALYENDQWYPLSENSEIAVIDSAYYEKLGLDMNKQEGLGDSNWNPSVVGPLLVNKAVDYIAAHANKQEPFFMYYCTQAVHSPHTPPLELDGQPIKGTTPSRHMDMIKELDVQMGMIVAELKKQGIYENTVFIFTSDNGATMSDDETIACGHQGSDIYRGHKGSYYEGGNRVPFIVSWPKEIEAGKTTKHTTIGVDIMATLAAITGTDIPTDQAKDSYNFLPVLKQDNNYSDRPVTLLQAGRKQRIIIDKGWKLIIEINKKDDTDKKLTPVALFDLNTNETENEDYNYINNPDYASKVDHLLDLYKSICFSN